MIPKEKIFDFQYLIKINLYYFKKYKYIQVTYNYLINYFNLIHLIYSNVYTLFTKEVLFQTIKIFYGIIFKIFISLDR